ncbi:MAG TPA: hemolysin III family protein [Actinobacteria bacterium]|nr:hemolysin III family protein [Actinomycetota bacterium]
MNTDSGYAADVQPPRWTLGKMQHPVRGFLHGAAALASVVVAVLLFRHAPSLPAKIGVLVFGIALVGLYATSSLYHSVPWSQRAKRRMQRLDHSMIYVLIAGTYTPFALVAFTPPLRWIVLGLVWGIAAAGIVQKAFFPSFPGGFSVALSTALGWTGAFFAWPLLQVLDPTGLLVVAAGGILYTVGMVFLVTNRPRLWPRVFSYHEAFHVLVVVASALHVFAVWRYVLPLAA